MVSCSRWMLADSWMGVTMAVKLSPALQRLGELHIQSKHRDLTDDEVIEFNHCLSVNAAYHLKLAHLHNLSLVASMTNDYDYLHEICQRIEELERAYS